MRCKCSTALARCSEHRASLAIGLLLQRWWLAHGKDRVALVARLLSVARHAEGLQVAEAVGAAERERDDVVDLIGGRQQDVTARTCVALLVRHSLLRRLSQLAAFNRRKYGSRLTVAVGF